MQSIQIIFGVMFMMLHCTAVALYWIVNVIWHLGFWIGGIIGTVVCWSMLMLFKFTSIVFDRD